MIGMLPPVVSRRQSAITCRSEYFSNAAIHFVQRSEAAIGLRMINFQRVGQVCSDCGQSV
jgi:hypothetical protein